jgi:hypothetical protein
MADDPTINAKERAELKLMLVEITKLLQDADNTKQYIKDAAEAAQEKFGIKKKLINKLAKTMYKHNYGDLQQENEHFSFLYESLIEGKKD